MTTEVKERPKARLATDKILIQGKVSIWQGEGKDRRVICRKVENHWVDQGLKGLLGMMLCDQENQNVYPWSGDFKMYLGSDTDTATLHGMTALTSPIGAAPGTVPDSISGANRTNPLTGKWVTSYTAVWNAGTVTGTVGEMALYLRATTGFAAGWDLTSNPTTKMVSRLSNEDGDFGSFSIDISKSLTVQWEVSVSYA